MLKAAETSFNTQPPEGGWIAAAVAAFIGLVSTHSRLKAAGDSKTLKPLIFQVSTHSRLKAAGGCCLFPSLAVSVSTHSRLKAAGCLTHNKTTYAAGFNTQPPEGGWSLSQKPCSVRFRSPDFAKLPRKARTRV